MPLPFTYRLGVDAHGTHGYEIVELDLENLMDPNAATIVDRVMGQQEAAAKTTFYNCGGAGEAQPVKERSSRATKPEAPITRDDDDGDHPHRAANKRHR